MKKKRIDVKESSKVKSKKKNISYIYSAQAFMYIEGMQLEKDALRFGAQWHLNSRKWYAPNLKKFMEAYQLENQVTGSNFQLIGNNPPFIFKNIKKELDK